MNNSESAPGDNPHECSGPRIPVLVVDDHEGYRRDLVALINGSRRYRCSQAFAGTPGLWEAVTKEPPRVALVDMQIGEARDAGIGVVRGLVQRCPDVLVAMLTCHDQEELLHRAICAGAVGYLIKSSTSAEELFPLLERLLEGGPCFSPGVGRKVLQVVRLCGNGRNRLAVLDTKERRLLELLATGKKHEVIAECLGVSPRTIRNWIGEICRKLGVATSVEAMVAFGRGTYGVEADD